MVVASWLDYVAGEERATRAARCLWICPIEIDPSQLTLA